MSLWIRNMPCGATDKDCEFINSGCIDMFVKCDTCKHNKHNDNRISKVSYYENMCGRESMIVLDNIVTAENQHKHFNFLKVNVLMQEDLDMFIKDDECTCLDDLDVSKTDFDWDYAQRALVNVDENKVIMWNDNIHSHIDREIDDFLDGITYVGNTYSLKEICMLEKDMEKYEGVRYK